MKGKCYYCSKELSKSGVLRHLKACKVVESSIDIRDKEPNKYILSISPKKSSSDFWMYVLMDKNAALGELDSFLREVWLECCGHLSMFEIDGQRYESLPDEDFTWGNPSKNMDSKIGKVASVKDKIKYEYDSGSTTELEIKVVDELSCSRRDKKIEIMARNNEHLMECSVGGEKAGYFNGNEEKYLPVISEPRAKKTEGLSQKNEKLIIEAVSKMRDDIMFSQMRREQKKWSPMDRDFSANYLLGRLTKDELLDIARNLDIQKVSSLKKDDLRDRILSLYYEKMDEFLYAMDIESFRYLLEIVKAGGTKSIDDVKNMHTLNYFRGRGALFSGSIDGKGAAVIPNELQNIINKRDNLEFYKHLKENHELIRLFWGMCHYYGAITLDNFKELSKRYVSYDISNRDIPAIVSNASVYYDGFEFEGHIGRDILVEDASYILEEHNKRGDLEFYPFTKDELLKVASNDYIETSPAYMEFHKFLTTNFNINEEQAEDLIFELESDVKNNKNFREVIAAFTCKFKFNNIAEANLVMSQVTKFANNTRNWVTKGYMPSELNPAAATVQESSQVENVQKVGRNEPCPCGSGKKYKKCCGR